MTSSTPALIDLVTKTVGSPVPDGKGGFSVVPDNDMIMYRLLDIPSDNYAAFVKEAKEFLNIAVQMSNKVRTVTYDRILREVTAIERYYQMSLTAKSSEDGKFIKELLRDETIQRLSVKEEGKQGLMQRFAAVQGDNESRDTQYQERR